MFRPAIDFRGGTRMMIAMIDAALNRTGYYRLLP